MRSRGSMIAGSLCAVFGIAFASWVAPAWATVTCQVRQTATGFILLRSAPFAQSPAIARLRSRGDCIVNQPSLPSVRRAGWGRFTVVARCGVEGVTGWLPLADLENCD